MLQQDPYVGEKDHTTRLRLHNVVIGRDKELEAIKMQFDNLLQGHSVWTAIAGDVGIGKTALVKTALADLSRLNATCAYGKFEQYKNEEPYIAIIQIISNITNHMLTLPKERLSRISKQLKNHLGKDGALLTGIVPQTERIIGRRSKTKVTDYKKLKVRLEAAFQIFITVAAKELYPLIITVDDLQWADKPSWDIIKSTNDPLRDYDMYIILAYRNNLKEYRTKIKLMLDELAGNGYVLGINLESLSHEAIKAMLAEVFAGEIENVDKLVRLLYRKTIGNPFYIKQMINLLLDKKEIFYNHQKETWCLGYEYARILNFPGDIEDIINRKVDGLSKQAKEFMELLACIGSRFSMEMLRKVIKNDSLIQENLLALCRGGLIIETLECTAEGRTGEFEFFHDRIYQYVYEQIDPDRKELLHYELAMELLDDPGRIYVEENILPITAHLLKCKSVIRKVGAEGRLIMDLYFAGIKAKQSAAVEHALKLFCFCEELLGDSCWQKDYDGILKIKLELAQCEYICGRYDASSKHFEEILANAADKDELYVRKQYMIMNSYAGNHAKVIGLGIQALKQLGVNINTRYIKLAVTREILIGKLLFRESRLDTIKNAPIVTDKRIVDAIEICKIMGPEAIMTDENLFALVVLKAGNLSAKYGNTQYSPSGYAAYSLLLGSVLGDFKKMEKLKGISLSQLELFNDDMLGCAVYFFIGTYIDHWTSPAQESIGYLQKAFDCGMRAGDYLYCGYSLSSMIEMKYSMGDSLYEIDKLLVQHNKYGQKMDHDLLLRSINIFRWHINMLTSTDFLPVDSLIWEKEIENIDTNEIMTYNLLMIQRMYLDGKIEEAYELMQSSVKQLDSITGSITQVDFVFYYLLLSLERMKCRKLHTNNLHKSIRKFRKKLKAWAELSPENHLGRHLLIEALYISLGSKDSAAGRLYDEAIEHAAKHNNLLLQALGNYLAAGYFSGSRRIAAAYARDAARLFKEWGAAKAAERVSILYRIDDHFTATDESAVVAVDEIPKVTGPEINLSFGERLERWQKELEALELEASFTYFLDTVCLESKADFGAILLENEEQVRLEYIRRSGESTVRCPAGIDPEQVEQLSQKVVRYASRTYEDVIIESKPTEGLFAGDDHIRSSEGISILCLPLKYNHIFAGLIYLESISNNRFEPMLVEYIKRLSFYLIAKQALEKDPVQSGRTFVNDTVRDRLTERETEVLRCIAEGLSNNEISKKLHVSSSTIKTHTLNLYRKLEVKNRLQAVAKGQELGL